MFSSQQLSLDKLKNFKRIGIAYSGGLDSKVLLTALVEGIEDKTKLYVLHINHGISPNSDLWEKACKDYSDSLGVKFYSKKIESKITNQSEGSLRKLRYRAFQSWSKEGDVICTAHHLDDQLETIFFRIMRGTGLYGLLGIPLRRTEFNFVLLRPLLTFSKKELLDYASTKNLSWIEDESNLDTKISRNYIRKIVFPVLYKFWPELSKSFLYLSKQARDAQIILDEVAESDFHDSKLESDSCLDISLITKLSDQRITNLLFFWLSNNSSLTLSSNQMESVVKLIIEKKDSKDYYTLINSPEEKNNVDLRAFKGVLYLLSGDCIRPLSGSNGIAWDLKSNLKLSTGDFHCKETLGSGIALEYLKEGITVKGRVGGERCKPKGRGKSQKLKKLLQETDLAPWLRDRIPLIYVGEELAAVGDLWVCEKFHAQPNEKGMSLNWQDSS
jgi:tRNA(Ile)-lysidine synthase